MGNRGVQLNSTHSGGLNEPSATCCQGAQIPILNVEGLDDLLITHAARHWTQPSIARGEDYDSMTGVSRHVTNSREQLVPLLSNRAKTDHTLTPHKDVGIGRDESYSILRSPLDRSGDEINHSPHTEGGCERSSHEGTRVVQLSTHSGEGTEQQEVHNNSSHPDVGAGRGFEQLSLHADQGVQLSYTEGGEHLASRDGRRLSKLETDVVVLRQQEDRIRSLENQLATIMEGQYQRDRMTRIDRNAISYCKGETDKMRWGWEKFASPIEECRPSG